MKISAILLILSFFVFAPAFASDYYNMGYDEGYTVGLREGSGDIAHGCKYKPSSHKRHKEQYADRIGKYQRGFKKGYRQGYRNAYKADAKIMLQKKRAILGR